MKWFGKRSAEQRVDTEWMQPEEPAGYQPGDLYTDEDGNVWQAFDAATTIAGQVMLGWHLIRRAEKVTLWAVVLYDFRDGAEGHAQGNIEKVIFCATEEQAWSWVREHIPPFYDVITAADR